MLTIYSNKEQITEFKSQKRIKNDCLSCAQLTTAVTDTHGTGNEKRRERMVHGVGSRLPIPSLQRTAKVLILLTNHANFKVSELPVRQ